MGEHVVEGEEKLSLGPSDSSRVVFYRSPVSLSEGQHCGSVAILLTRHFL